MSKKWQLVIRGRRYNDNGLDERIHEVFMYEGDELIDVGKQVWRDHFLAGDNIDDYGTGKLDPIGDEEVVWTVVRECNNGDKYRAIYRLYDHEKVTKKEKEQFERREQENIYNRINGCC